RKCSALLEWPAEVVSSREVRLPRACFVCVLRSDDWVRSTECRFDFGEHVVNEQEGESSSAMGRLWGLVRRRKISVIVLVLALGLAYLVVSHIIHPPEQRINGRFRGAGGFRRNGNN